jgi:DNA-binding response OmpR family regulator
MSIRALLIDDDDRLFELLSSYLGDNDVELAHAPDGGRGLAALEKDVYDAVLLDVMMPGLSGLEVLSRLRGKESQVPIIMLTAKGDETDRIVGLELGADDYVSKPFSPRELLARIRAVLRRAQPGAVSEKLQVGPITLDTGRRAVSVDGVDVELTAIEFDLLLALCRRPGRVLPRESMLSEAGRGDVIVSERTVDVHVSHLRKKLGRPDLIKTVRGVGYVLAEVAE